MTTTDDNSEKSTNDAIIEAMARAMCEEEGYDPDELISVNHESAYAKQPAWFAFYGVSARLQFAAHRAMVKAEKEQGE